MGGRWSSWVASMSPRVASNAAKAHGIDPVPPDREGCTLFVFLAKHRGSAHGPPRHSTDISTAFHGQPWTLHGLPWTPHGLPRIFHGLPRNAATSSGTPWRLMALAMAFSTAIPTARSTAIFTAISDNPRQATHGIPRQAAVQRKDPRHGGGHGICRGSCRGTSVVCHGWYHGGYHGQNCGTCHCHNHGTCRGRAMYNGKPWPLQWKPVDFHGGPWRDPRKTTEMLRSSPRTSTKKPNSAHLCRPRSSVVLNKK